MNAELPSSWLMPDIHSFTIDIQPGFARQPNASNEGCLQLRMPSISRSGYIDYTVSKFVDASDDEKAKYAVRKGDVIFNNTNSPELVGNAAVYQDTGDCVLSNHMTRIRVDERIIVPAYLAAVLHRYWRTGQTQRRSKQWINQAAIDIGTLSRFRIPLPPLSEQQRIVDILQEAETVRRLRTQAETKTAELIPALFHEMFGDPVANPKKWRKAPLGELINGTPKNGLYKPADLYGEGTPIIRIGDFTGGILRDAKGLQRVRISDDEASQFGVANGQIVINRVNSIEHLGKCLLLAGLTEPTVYESNMMRLDPKVEEVLPDYLIACLQHNSVVSKLRAKAKKAINQASINQTDVVTLEIPVPQLEAQQEFVRRIRAVDEILSSETQTLRQGHLLEESLSAHAFSGELTAKWRKANENKLTAEARERDAALAETGSTPRISRRATIEEIDRIFADRTDGIYSDLNREQRFLLREIKRMFAGVDYGRYFTAEKIADDIEGPLHRNPQGVLAHLQVFAIRGLLIPVTRRRKDTAGSPFAGCYRLPLKSSEKRIFSGVEDIELPEQAGDGVKEELMKIQRRLATGSI